MKRFLFLSLLSVLVLSGCQLFDQTSVSNGGTLLVTTQPNLEEPAAVNIAPTPTAYPLGERFKINNYYLNTPQNWFYTVVNEDNMLGWVFTPNDPLLMADQGFTGWSAIVWLVTPIPQGTDVQEMHQQMIARVGTYSDDELQAVLLPAQETGLIEITDEPVMLEQAQVVKWGGVDALLLKGIILFSGSTPTQVDVSVYLTWNGEEFITFYQFSDHDLTETLTPAFLASRESIQMP